MDESLDVISGENQIKIHSDENDANDANDETIKIEAGIRQNWIESNVERQRETFGQNVRKKLWRHFGKYMVWLVKPLHSMTSQGVNSLTSILAGFD